MPAELKPGMDHSIYSYSPIGSREILRWPGSKPVAISVVLYLDYWELETPADHHKPPEVQGMWGHQFPDLRTFSYRLYGERIGVYRILRLLEKYRVRATIAVGSEICKRYPELVIECAQAGHEIAAHGTHATRMITSKMTEQQELEHIHESTAAIESCIGIRPTGWFGQYQNESSRTPFLLAQQGFSYLGDWSNDEQPYELLTTPKMVSFPIHPELDDMQVLWMRQQPAWDYPGMVRDAVNQMVTDGQINARSLSLGLRSWIAGRPHRIRYVDEALWEITRRQDVWVTTAADIVNHYLQQKGS